MNLYNILFGDGGATADQLLALLGTSKAEVPRYRDCYYDGERDRIVIHTRTGGGNRDEYALGNDGLCDLPGYTGDEDDDFDSTYANFYYRVPDEFRKIVEDLGPNAPAAERWQALFDALNAQTSKH